MRAALASVVLVAFGGSTVADPRGELAAPIAVKSVTGLTTDVGEESALWQVLMPQAEDWCQAKPGANGAGTPLTITFAVPTAIATVEIYAPIQYAFNAIDSFEVTADGKVFSATRAPKADRFPIKLGGTAVTTLTVKVTKATKGNADVNCVQAIWLHTDAEAAVIIGLDPAAAGAFWPNVKAVKAALRSCKAKDLGKHMAFPVLNTWFSMTNDGMKENSLTMKNAAAAVKACKRGKFKEAVAVLKFQEPKVNTKEPGKKLEIFEGNTTFGFELDGDRWRLRTIDGT